MIPGEPKIAHTHLGDVEYFEEGTGPVVLCVHGAMGGYDQSITLGRTVGDSGYRYIAVSRPGYLGTSIGCGKTAQEQADLHVALLDKLGIDSAVFIAISGGGPSALYFALTYPERCSKLILCSTVAQAAPQKIPFSFTLMTMLARITPLIEVLRKKTEENFEKAMARSIEDPQLLKKTLADAEACELFKVVIVGSFERMAERTTGTKNDIRISSEFTCSLENITVPTLVIHGDNDPLLPYEKHGKVLATRIPNAKLCQCLKGGHASIFSHREQVREAVAGFLED